MTVMSVAPFSVDPLDFTDDCGFRRVIVQDAQSNILAEVAPMADQDALAQMFAAAHDMLAALRTVIAWDDSEGAGPDDIDWQHFDAAMTQVRLAVAKAEGRG